MSKVEIRHRIIRVQSDSLSGRSFRACKVPLKPEFDRAIRGVRFGGTRVQMDRLSHGRLSQWKRIPAWNIAGYRQSDKRFRQGNLCQNVIRIELKRLLEAADGLLQLSKGDFGVMKSPAQIQIESLVILGLKGLYLG